MTLRFLDTPLAPPTWPGERSGGLSRPLLDAFVAVGGGVPRADDLASDRVLVVTTGQQPGLFTGPAYTIHKALSARALATTLQARWQRPVVPVFWLAGDDHDFAEATHTAWVAATGELRRWTSPPRPPGAPSTPMYREPLPADTALALEQLGRDLEGAEYARDALAWLSRHYRAGESVGSAYRGALAELLAPLGIACFDPTHPSARRAMAPWLLRAAGAASDLDAALAREVASLTAAGRDPGVAAGDGATLVMLEGAAGRDRLVLGSGGFRTRRGAESLTVVELEQLASEEPVRLSPNVLLRPVVEAALLPTVSYVAGPGELRYLAATGPVYRALGVTPQLPVPRWSGIVIEPFVDRTLPKLGTSLDEILRDGKGLASRIARRDLPAEAVGALGMLRESVSQAFALLAARAPAIDPSLVRTMQGLRDRSLHSADQAERKLVRALRRRDSDANRQLARLLATLRPGGEPQERVLNVVPWIARYGPGFLPALAGAVESWYAGALEGLPVAR